MDESYIAEHAGEIGEYFAVCSACDMESRGAYYQGPGSDKLLLADWSFETLEGELYGRVDVRLTEPMTEKEENAFRDWIREVNADGIGRSFERQPVSTDMGALHISLWTDSDNYFIYDAEEMQRAVDGHMETVYMGDSTILICNEEGKVKGMDCNRRVGDDVIAGPFFIVGEDGEDFRSLTDEEAQRYMERFAQPVQIEQEEVQNDMGFSTHFF